MRRTPVLTLLCFILVSAAGLSFAASRADFDAVVDFSVTLKTLSAAADGQAAVPYGKILILEGTVSEVAVLDKEQQSFKARVELVSGEWLGVEDVKLYSCLVDFSGPRFAKILPVRAPRSPSPELIVSGSRIIVVARALQIAATLEGEKRVLCEALEVRPIH